MEVAVRPAGERWVVSYDETGVEGLVSQMVDLGTALVLLEATGGLELPLVAALAAAALPVVVVVVNPRQVRDFARATGTLKVVSNRINAFLQATPAMPRFRNPALRSERFDKGWDKSQYRNFQANFEAYNKRINDAFEETNDDVSIQKWRNLFGRNFG